MSPEAERLRRALWGDDPQVVCEAIVTELGITDEMVEKETILADLGRQSCKHNRVGGVCLCEHRGAISSALSTLLEVSRQP